MAKYDFLIVGAGFFGATCARLLTDKGYNCLIVEQRSIVGGNCATKRVYDIDVHMYGPHVLHTDDKEVWDFLNKYGKIIPYKHEVVAYSEDKLYHLPINMNTFNDVFEIYFPQDAIAKIEEEINKFNVPQSTNLEEYAINSCGYTIYNQLIKGYSEKLWGTECKNINPIIFSNFPIRFIYDNSYFNDEYQGIPEDGYTKLIENIIGDDIDIMLNTNYLDNRDKLDKLASYVIFSGPIDKFCNYVYGPLKWRSIRFETVDESSKGNNIFGNSVINIPDKDNELLRITEHKWFTKDRVKTSEEFNKHTIVTYEYAEDWKPGLECLYPILDEKNEEILNKYIKFTEDNFPNFIFGGRQGIYKPISMCETIQLAMNIANVL